MKTFLVLSAVLASVIVKADIVTTALVPLTAAKIQLSRDSRSSDGDLAELVIARSAQLSQYHVQFHSESSSMGQVNPSIDFEIDMICKTNRTTIISCTRDMRPVDGPLVEIRVVYNNSTKSYDVFKNQLVTDMSGKVSKSQETLALDLKNIK